MHNFLQRTKQYHPIFATALGILFVSTASIFIRFAQEEASSLVIAASRLLISSCILIPLAIANYLKEFKELSSKDWARGVLSGLFLALHFSSWTTSLALTSIASSVVLVTTTPLWVALFSPFVLKESIQRSVMIGLVVSIIGSTVVGIGNNCNISHEGIVCFAFGASNQALLGNFLALFGAWMAAGYMMMGRQLRKKQNTIPYTALVYGIAATILSLIVFLRAEPVFTYSRHTYLWLLALGIFPQLLGHSSLNWALKYLPASFVSLTLLGEPIGTIVLALIFLNERPTLLEGLGAGLILLGIIIASTQRKPQS